MSTHSSNPSDWTVTPLAGALGAEVRGLDLAQVEQGEIDAISQLLLDHLVLFFPGQSIDMAAHVRFGRFFGHLEGHPELKNPYPEFPEVFELKATTGGIADEWHTDLTFLEEPALMSVLHMRKCPSVGGDTMWTNLYAAFEALSAPMQELCEGLTALHDELPHNRPDQMTIHPVVRVHPETGRKALYVNEHFTRRIVEMNADESDALLSMLTRWVQQPRFTVRYNWTEGTLGMWDNRCTQHFVLNDFTEERVIQRVTVMGDKPEGVGAPKWQPWIREGNLSATSRQDRQLFLYLRTQAKKAEREGISAG